MKWSGLLCRLLSIPVVSAAPALVWQQASGAASLPTYTSEDMPVNELFRSVDESSLQVIFVVGRNDDGSETLSSWTAAGSLPGVAQAAPQALAIHHGVSVQSTASLTQSAKTVDQTAVQVRLDELKYKIEHKKFSEELQVGADGQIIPKKIQQAHKRARALEKANTLIVDVPASTDPSILDEAVVDAIEREFSVVLTAVRSVQEVKMERSRQAQERMARMTEATSILKSRRRLEDAEQQYNGQQNRNGQQDLGSVYYVSMTPNIMAGILFFFLFTFIAWIGLTCMGMIVGQDVYVKKMPSIGREA